ncbi:MAG: CHAT domain-containing tetratricopeptide repeat protein [Chryseolinea sp.]
MRRIISVILFAALSYTTSAQPSGTPFWKIYYDSAQLFWGKDWQKTIPLLTRAENSALNDLGIYDENYLTIINDLGLAYAHTHDFANAEKILTKGLSIKTEINSAPNAALFRSMNNLAGVHVEQQHFQQAEQLYKKVLSAPGNQTEPDIYWLAAKNLVNLYESNDQIEKALQTLNEQKLKLNVEGKTNPVDEYEMSLARGRINRKLRKYEDARIILEPIVRDLHDQTAEKLVSLYIQSLQETGLLYFETGSFNKAEKNLLQGFRLLKSQQPVDQVRLAELLNNLASVYERLGIYDKALIYYEESLELCNQLHGKNSFASTTLQSNIAGIQLKQENLSQAISHYAEILKNLPNLVPESNPFYITVLNNLATAYRKNNQYKEAALHLDQAYKLIQKYKLENDDLAATVMNNLAVLLTARGEPDKAITYYEKAYAIKKSIYGDNSVLLTDLASNMAVVYWALHRPELSIPLFQKSIALAIRQIKYTFPGLSESEQVQFYQKLKEDFERFNTIAFESITSRPELITQVFNNQIMIKSLLFFSQQHQRDLIRENGDSLLIQQYEVLKAKREQLGYLYQLSLKALASANATTTELEKEIERLEKSLSQKTSESLAEKMTEQSVQWQDIQSKMQPDEALIDVVRFRKYDLKTYREDNASRVSFGFTDSIYYATLITTRETVAGPQLVLIREGRKMETLFLNYYRNSLIYDVADENSYQHFWKPFEGRIHGKTKIYFAADGVYHQLNLNTLRNPVKDQFLIQQYDIHYLLNPAQFLEKKKTSFSSKKAVLFGDPVFNVNGTEQAKSRDGGTEGFAALPGTNTEIVKINEILKGKAWTTSIYLKRLASEKNLKNVHSPDILHIATHGFFSTDRITLSAGAKKDFLFHSGLVFSGADRTLNQENQEVYDDGILTAYEVMNLDLSQTQLVVLSACETGLGKIENGEGVYGLQRSFLQAGARNIMISLWKVDDNATQELMVKFYQYLFQGKSERESLKLAQLDMQKISNNPMRWGGFIVVGAD